MSELTGIELDEAVARVLGIAAERKSHEGSKWLAVKGTPWSPAARWVDGGPIIECEKIELVPVFYGQGWYARHREKSCDGDQVFGETALIAAMRAFVASKTQ